MSQHPRFPRAALFDLDGTLLDSAPDMLVTANRLRASRGLAPLPLQAIRQHVSKGARVVAQRAFPDLSLAEVDTLVPEFLAIYREEMERHSAPFPGVAEMLDALERAGTVWGIVSNKAEALAKLCLRQPGWGERCAILIGGDTLSECKPHPLPLLHAAKRLGISPAECVYVGDDLRDIQAARAAGMRSVVALWGYYPDGDDPRTWGGDVLVETAGALTNPAVWPLPTSA